MRVGLFRNFTRAKLLLALTVAFSCLVLFVSCGGSSKKILYVIAPGTTNIGEFQIDSSGALASTSNTTATGSTVRAILLNPQRTALYVANDAGPSVNGAVIQYQVNKGSGFLQSIPNNSATQSVTTTILPVDTGISPVSMATDSDGTFLFVANKGSNSISVFSISSTDGSLTEVSGSPFATVPVPVQVAVRGSSVFVAGQGTGSGGSIAVYSFDSKSGALTAAGAPVIAGQHLTGMDVDSTGKFLFATDDQLNEVLAFTVNSGTVAPASTPSYAVGTAPSFVRVNPGGGAVYVANQGSNNLSAFNLDSSGALSAASGSPFSVGTGPVFITTDAADKLMFVANFGSGNVSVFKVNNGALTSVNGSPFATSGFATPNGLATIN